MGKEEQKGVGICEGIINRSNNWKHLVSCLDSKWADFIFSFAVDSSLRQNLFFFSVCFMVPKEFKILKVCLFSLCLFCCFPKPCAFSLSFLPAHQPVFSTFCVSVLKLLPWHMFVFPSLEFVLFCPSSVPQIRVAEIMSWFDVLLGASAHCSTHWRDASFTHYLLPFTLPSL